MITKMKRNGATSTAGDNVKKGYKGRLDLVAERREDGLHLVFRDVGNYGKDRWVADFGVLTADELLTVAAQLTAVVQGNIQSTALSQDQIDRLVSEVEDRTNEDFTPPETEATLAEEDTETHDIEQLSAD